MSDQQSPDPRIIKLTNWRLSFPSLFKARSFKKGEGTPKYSAAFLGDKTANAADIKKLQAAIALCIKEDGKGKHPGADRVCLQDGAKKEDTEGYGPGIMFVSASNEKKPRVVDGQLNDLDEDSGKPFAGCYVDAVIRLWYQDNEYGKRVNASLRSVQYRRKGEPFGEGALDVEKFHERIEEEDESVV